MTTHATIETVNGFGERFRVTVLLDGSLRHGGSPMSNGDNDSWAAVRDRVVHILDFEPPGTPSAETADAILRMVQEQETGKLCKLFGIPRAGVLRVWINDEGGLSVLPVAYERSITLDIGFGTVDP